MNREITSKRLLAWAGFVLVCLAPPVSAAELPTGRLAGTLSYPSEEIPPMRVYAFAADGLSYYTVSTNKQQRRFVIPNVPAGRYTLVAYPAPSAGAPAEAGGWSRAIPCGLTVKCTDHSLIPVHVRPGQTVAGIDIADWYAPANAFPVEPTRLSRRYNLSNECASKTSLVDRDRCNLAGYRVVDADMKSTYDRLVEAPGLSAPCRKKLTDDQTSWLEYRAEHCAAPASGYQGHTSECLRGATEQRLAFLRRQAPGTCIR